MLCVVEKLSTVTGANPHTSAGNFNVSVSSTLSISACRSHRGVLGGAAGAWSSCLLPPELPRAGSLEDDRE